MTTAQDPAVKGPRSNHAENRSTLYRSRLTKLILLLYCSILQSLKGGGLLTSTTYCTSEEKCIVNAPDVGPVMDEGSQA